MVAFVTNNLYNTIKNFATGQFMEVSRQTCSKVQENPIKMFGNGNCILLPWWIWGSQGPKRASACVSFQKPGIQSVAEFYIYNKKKLAE